MISFCISSAAWLGHREATVAVIERVLQHAQDTSQSILVDLQTVLREDATLSAASGYVHEIDLREWVNETLIEGGVINIEHVRRKVLSFRPDDIVAIRAVGFMPSLIRRMLAQVHVGLYGMATWPKALALVCDDAQIYQLGPALANTFFLRPALLVDIALDRFVRQQLWRARWLRLFGLKTDRVSQVVHRLFEWRRIREDRKVAKQAGWTWEE